MRLTHSKFHFIGIGGIGMSGLAELLLNMGASITGSDQSENDQTHRLESLGIKIFKGHTTNNVGDVDVVVYSSAIPNSNPEIQAARQRKIPIIPRAEVLAEVMRLKRGIAVAGTHGKTTTTSMLASVFIHADLDPTVVVGGRLDLIKSTSKLGAGVWLIGEADESDGSFLKLQPEISVITNIDNDHLDHYRSIDNVRMAFLEFAKKTPFYGVCVVNGDDPETKKIFQNFDKKMIFYGFDPSNDYILKKEDEKFGIWFHGNKIGSFQLRVYGDHNALNALASIIVGQSCGIDLIKCIEGVEQFSGVDRRMQLIGSADNIRCYDDYGHHPTEIRAVLKAFREKYKAHRIVVAFQPHRFSRTKDSWNDFLTAFVNCDELYVWDIYAASEKPIEGITAKALLKDIKHPSAHYVDRNAFQASEFKKNLKSGDIFLTLGAGDIYKFGRQVLAELQK